MTLATQTSKAAFSGNGVTTVFPLPFPFLREGDIKALLRQDGFETPLEPGAHYTLAGAGSATGGSLTLANAPATGQTLVVYRAPAIVQEVDYVENSAFPAETHEAALDLLTMICQSLQEQLGRAVLYPVSTPAEDILNSESFLAAGVDSRNAARISEQSAAASAGQAAVSAGQAAASADAAAERAEAAAGVIAGFAATADGLVKVSVGDGQAQTLSAKLLAGNGLSEDIENPGGAEALRLAVALAANSGLEFGAGLLRVKAGTGLALSASGLAADVGTAAGKLVQLDAGGRLPAVDGRNLSGILDQTARDEAAMNAFLAHILAGRGAGPVPNGGVWPLQTNELGGTGAIYDAAGRFYAPIVTLGADITPVMTAASSGGFTASSSSTLGAGFEAFQAFNGVGGADGSANIGFLANAGSAWLQLDCGSPRRIGAYTLQSGNQYHGSRSPSAWTFEGCDDGSSWLVLDSRSGVSSWSAAEKKSFALAEPAAYRFYRLNITANNGAGAYVGVVEMELLSASPCSNMSLNSGLALGYTPTRATIYLLHKALDAVVLNADLVVSASRYSNWAAATDLTALCQYDANYKLLRATVDLSGLVAGTTGYFGISTANNKAQRVRAVLALFN